MKLKKINIYIYREREIIPLKLNSEFSFVPMAIFSVKFWEKLVLSHLIAMDTQRASFLVEPPLAGDENRVMLFRVKATKLSGYEDR